MPVSAATPETGAGAPSPASAARAPGKSAWRRWRRRLLWHHLPLLLLTGAVCGAIFWLFRDADLLFRQSLATGYAGLLLLTATLLVGPLNVLRRRHNPTSSDLRRDMGVWAAGLGLTHTLLHLRTALPRPFWRLPDEVRALPLRWDLTALANDAGLAAALLLLGLLLLSNDASIRGLGLRRWKAWQRLSYAVLPLVALHTWLYQQQERRAEMYSLIAAALVALIIGGQVAGWRRRAAAGRLVDDRRGGVIGS